MHILSQIFAIIFRKFFEGRRLRKRDKVMDNMSDIERQKKLMKEILKGFGIK